MTRHQPGPEEPDHRQGKRAAVVIGLLILTGLSHWITPTSRHYLYPLHIVLRKFFIIPIVLAAIWFDMRGAVLAAAGATLLYVPHIFVQWAGRSAENINQIGEHLYHPGNRDVLIVQHV